jgi:hypothetical protein
MVMLLFHFVISFVLQISKFKHEFKYTQVTSITA